MFYEACSVRTRSDVPFSSFLSGGIDSTAVTKNLNEVLDSVDTFSIVQKSPNTMRKNGLILCLINIKQIKKK